MTVLACLIARESTRGCGWDGYGLNRLACFDESRFVTPTPPHPAPAPRDVWRATRPADRYTVPFTSTVRDLDRGHAALGLLESLPVSCMCVVSHCTLTFASCEFCEADADGWFGVAQWVAQRPVIKLHTRFGQYSSQYSTYCVHSEAYPAGRFIHHTIIP